MIEMKYTDEELEILDKYMTEDWNHYIYEQLCGDESDGKYKDLFDPLEFLQLFYSMFDFINEHKHRPLFVRKHLEELHYSYEQLNYLYSKLYMYFESDIETDEQISICFREISKFKKKFGIKVDEDGSSDFQPFAEICPSTETEIIEVAKDRDLTIDRAIQLLDLFIPHYNSSSAMTKANFISIFTGFNSESVRQRYTNIKSKCKENAKAYKDDQKILKKFITQMEFKNETENQLILNLSDTDTRSNLTVSKM